MGQGLERRVELDDDRRIALFAGERLVAGVARAARHHRQLCPAAAEAHGTERLGGREGELAHRGARGKSCGTRLRALGEPQGEAHEDLAAERNRLPQAQHVARGGAGRGALDALDLEVLARQAPG